ncbi:MAG: TonB-dependent receptor [Pirellulaceae bacterium]|nr:TonB-dependent receptor [Pirellulaceae bacterium]
MGGPWYKIAIRVASKASISLAGCYLAGITYSPKVWADNLPPVVTAQAESAAVGSSLSDQAASSPKAGSQDLSSDGFEGRGFEGPSFEGPSFEGARPAANVTSIPSVFDNSHDAVQPVSCSTNAPCGSCDACDSIGCASASCVPWWAHRSGGFGELLYLSPGNSDLIYATEQTGPVGAPSPTGPIGISNIDEHVGYRVGFIHAHSTCSSLVASYTRWDGETTSVLQATGNNVLNSNVIHPSTATTGAASLQATARQLANFQFADVMLRRVYRSSDCGVINWNAGLRYGNLEQGLSADQTVSVGTGLTNVTTDIDFNGFGIIGGLDGMRHSTHTGLLVYGRALGSLLGGNWQADYRQTNQFGGGVIANRYDDYRVTPVVDTELGVGWQNCSGCLRVTTGYLFSTWFNAVTTRDYIQSVRTGNMLNLDDNLTFSGLSLRTDLRF